MVEDKKQLNMCEIRWVSMQEIVLCCSDRQIFSLSDICYLPTCSAGRVINVKQIITVILKLFLTSLVFERKSPHLYSSISTFGLLLTYWEFKLTYSYNKKAKNNCCKFITIAFFMWTPIVGSLFLITIYNLYFHVLYIVVTLSWVPRSISTFFISTPLSGCWEYVPMGRTY